MPRGPVTQPDLVHELGTLDADNLFTAARHRQRAFDDHPTVWTVLDALRAGIDEDDYSEAEPLLRALLLEYQARAHRFWSAVLLIAFWPALRKIAFEHRALAYADHLPAVVTDAFLWTARHLDLGRHLDRTAMRLRNGTRERVRTWARGERRHRARHLPTTPRDDEEGEGQAVPEERTSHLSLDALDARRILGALLTAHGPEVVASLLATEAGGEPLKRRLGHLSEADDTTREREYQRLRKAQQRARAAILAMIDEGDVPRADLAAPSFSRWSPMERK